MRRLIGESIFSSLIHIIDGNNMEIAFVYGLLISIGLGGLIGLEREHRREGDTLVGIRTFPLISMSGYLLSYIGRQMEGLEIMAPIGLVIFGALALSLIYIRQAMGFPGFTTTLAFIITYLLGLMVAYDFILEAVIVAVAVTTILLFKERAHAFVHILDEGEIIGALQFITIAFILFPLTLDLRFEEPWTIFGEGQPLDLNMALLIIVFVSGISFASFLVVRWQGPSRGLRFSGLLGGLINSEAATASLCGLAKKKREVMSVASCGIIMANATMFLRNLAVCVFADPSMKVASAAALPLLTISAFGIALGWGKERVEGVNPLEVGSPFAIRPALIFGIIFFLISGAALIAQDHLGEQAIYFVALGGFASSAAVVASVSSLSLAGSIPAEVGAEVVLLACAISSFNKIVITRIMCPMIPKKTLIKLLLIGFAALIATGALVILRTLP